MTQPPEAVLIRLVRQAAGITVDAASARAGISKARWTQVETGREKRKDGYHRAVAPPGTLARMAHAVPGVTPERLEEAGRPDAADVLREILRSEQAPAPPEDRPHFPDDPVLDQQAEELWNLKSLPVATKLAFIERARQQRQMHEDRPARRAAG